MLLGACARDENPPLVGSLEWDRIAVTAELAEPVLSWAVAEGDRVEAGAVLLEQDARRQDARIAEAHGNLMQAEARLEELAHGATHRDHRRGARESRARAGRRGRRRYRVQARRRAQDAPARRNVARSTRRSRRATSAAPRRRPPRRSCASSRSGTRPEQVEQAAAAVEAAKAALASLELTRERLTVRAPRAGRVDALPFRAGDQPPVGAELVSLLVGDAPYARVFVPAPRRAGAEDRRPLRGPRRRQRPRRITATLRSIRSEPSFTPYYALAGDDASRLVYRAELLLDGADASELPAGLPLTARSIAGARAMSADGRTPRRSARAVSRSASAACRPSTSSTSR